MTYDDLRRATGYKAKTMQRKTLESWGLDVSRVRSDGTVAITWSQYYAHDDRPKNHKKPELIFNG